MAYTVGSWEALNAWLSRQTNIAEQPLGSNCQIYSHKLGRPCEFWCQDYAACGAVDNKINVFGGEKTAYTPNAAAAYQKAGRYGKVARVGAQFFVYHSSVGRIAHTGWVVAVLDGGKTIVTSEGNSNTDGSRNGIKVVRLHRKVDSSITFGYPLYKTNTGTGSKPPAKPTPPPVLRNGSRGQYVLDLQGRLRTLGLYKGGLDGDFGAATEKAVKAFQTKYALKPVDGVVGNVTWSKLYALT